MVLGIPRIYKDELLENQTDTDDGSKDQNAVMSTVPSVRDHSGRGRPVTPPAGDASYRGCGRHMPVSPHSGSADVCGQ